jgi:hypothetical protein
LELNKRRDRLQTRLDHFKRTATVAFGDIDLDEFDESFLGSDGEGDRMDPSSDQDNTSHTDSDNSNIADANPEYARSEEYTPEAAPLPLPSMLGSERCHEYGLNNLAEMELRLREGQANDSLRGLRIALSEKAVLFQAQVRHAHSQAKKTRAWANVTVVESIVKLQSRIYARARKAMTRLAAPDAVLTRYRRLRREELRASTQIIDPSIPGQRNIGLPWFWVMGVDRDVPSANWMQECDFSCPFALYHWLNCC